jgi:hypothetical protein
MANDDNGKHTLALWQIELWISKVSGIKLTVGGTHDATSKCGFPRAS